MKRSATSTPTHASQNGTHQDPQAISVQFQSATPSISPSGAQTSELSSSPTSEVPSFSGEVRERLENDQEGSNETISTASDPSVITVFLPNAVVSPPPTQPIESRMVLPTPTMSPSPSSSPRFTWAQLFQMSTSPCPSPSMTPLKASLVSSMQLDAMEPTVLDMPPVPTWGLVSPSGRINVEIGGADDGSGENADGVAGSGDTEIETSAEAKEESSREVTGGWFCFPGSATVLLSNGKTVGLSSLNVGDQVMVGDGSFSKVVAFTHRDGSARMRFVRVHLTNGLSLRASAGHYVFRGGEAKLVPIRNVQVGDVMQTVKEGESRLTVVQKVDTVWDRGLFNAQTESGDIVVDGVRASCYTEAIDPMLGHSLLTVVRAIGRSVPWMAARMVSVGVDDLATRVRHMVNPMLFKEL